LVVDVDGWRQWGTHFDVYYVMFVRCGVMNDESCCDSW
jgi:hypothetical protein